MLADEVRIALQTMATDLDRSRYSVTNHWIFARVMTKFKELGIQSVFEPGVPSARELAMTNPQYFDVPWLTLSTKDDISLVRKIMRSAAQLHAPTPLDQRLVWYPRDFGLPTQTGGPHGMVFYSFKLPWMIDWAKKWAKYEIRIGRQAFSSLLLNVTGMRHLDNFLAQQDDCPTGIDGISRDHIERFLLWLRADTGPGIDTGSIVSVVSRVRTLFNTHKELQWNPVMQPAAILRRGETPKPKVPEPKPFDPVILSRLMSSENLSLLSPWLAEAMIIGRHQGLRPSSVVALSIDCLQFNTENDDRPVLRYYNVKLTRPASQPILQKAVVEAIRRQQARVQEQYGGECKLLFPSINNNKAGSLQMSPSTLQGTLNHFLANVCDVRDRMDNRVTSVTWGQFRDTRATELLNAGVSPTMVAEWLDHTHLGSLQHYGKVHAETLRHAIEHSPLINLAGEEISADVHLQRGLDRSVEELRRLVKQATNAVQGGYCTLPVQEECPHLNRCYSCRKFATTTAKLPNLLAHLQDSQMLIISHQENGRTRMAETQKSNTDGLQNIVTVLSKNVLATPPNEPHLANWVQANMDTLMTIVTETV